MRIFRALFAILAIASPEGAIAAGLTKALVGRYEDTAINCGIAEPTEGATLRISVDQGRLDFAEADYSAEGGDCLVSKVAATTNGLMTVEAMCREETQSRISEVMTVRVSTDGKLIGLAHPDSNGTVVTFYHRCPVKTHDQATPTDLQMPPQKPFLKLGN